MGIIINSALSLVLQDIQVLDQSYYSHSQIELRAQVKLEMRPQPPT